MCVSPLSWHCSNKGQFAAMTSRLQKKRVSVCVCVSCVCVSCVCVSRVCVMCVCVICVCVSCVCVCHVCVCHVCVCHVCVSCVCVRERDDLACEMLFNRLRAKNTKFGAHSTAIFTAESPEKTSKNIPSLLSCVCVSVCVCVLPI